MRKKKRIELKCQQCGKSHFKLKCQLGRGRGKYCSKDCRIKHTRKRKPHVCEYCNKTYLRFPCETEGTDKKFCSVRCYQKHRREHAKKTTYLKKGATHIHRIISENYNDFGHNHGNGQFFKQMDFLTPELLRVLTPGRIAAIHVKDRIRYSYQNGTSFTTISDFSGQTVAHFEKHGFFLMGKITVTTDVVSENNQTYRLGWTENTKDASKMGVGLPEYILLFRKKPSQMKNAYADMPVSKEKREYTKARWQLDAHAYQRSSGNRFLTPEELKRFDVRRIAGAWKSHNQTEIYDFLEHLKVCEELDQQEKLSSTFMTLPVHSNNDGVWTDVNRMNTLNTKQVNAKKEKHICPLQLDIIERLINRYTMKGETVLDPFGGIFSVPYKALEMGRKAISFELNSEYFNDGLFYVKAMLHKLNVPTLFDLTAEEIKQ